MKKLFIASLMVISVFTSAFAAEDITTGSSATYMFNTNFKGATNITWTTKGDFTKAAFTKDNQKMEAFFNSNGDLISTSTSVTINDLPTSAKRTLAKNYATYTISEAISLDYMDETSYYVSATNGKESKIIKIAANGESSIFDTVK